MVPMSYIKLSNNATDKPPSKFSSKLSHKLSHKLSKEGQAQLLQIARRAIAGHFDSVPLNIDIAQVPEELARDGASFVTLLDSKKELRGCIGTLEAHQSTIVDVAEHAVAAAFRDYRFPGLTKDEFQHCSISISLLTPREPIPVTCEEELLNEMQPDIGGIIIKDGNRQATFLPKVWEQISEKEEFLRHLKSKAGFLKDEWPATMQCWRYRCIEFSE